MGDRLVCVQRANAIGNGSGVAGDIHYAGVYHFGEDGRLVEVNEIRDARRGGCSGGALFAAGDSVAPAPAAHE